MTDPTETAAPVTTDRAFSTADLAYINRMTTTGMVLPSVAHEVNNYVVKPFTADTLKEKINAVASHA